MYRRREETQIAFSATSSFLPRPLMLMLPPRLHEWKDGEREKEPFFIDVSHL